MLAIKLNCIIVDDEQHNVQLLESYVAQDENLVLVGKFTDPVAGLARANQLDPDLIFLDVNMPDLDGFDFMQKLTSTAKIVLTTAHLSNIRDADGFAISGYLLKPYPFRRFQRCMARIKAMGILLMVSHLLPIS